MVINIEKSMKGHSNYKLHREFHKYLNLDSVHDGRKGDVLSLLSLCMLIEKHVLVHLNNGQIWMSLHDAAGSHDTLLSKVDIHLVYLG